MSKSEGLVSGGEVELPAMQATPMTKPCISATLRLQRPHIHLPHAHLPVRHLASTGTASRSRFLADTISIDADCCAAVKMSFIQTRGLSTLIPPKVRLRRPLIIIVMLTMIRRLLLPM